jgi:hypothetical protein
VINKLSINNTCANLLHYRPSQIHCLNSDGTGDLSLLRYKPDFVISLFFINELYCIYFQIYYTWLRHTSKLTVTDKQVIEAALKQTIANITSGIINLEVYTVEFVYKEQAYNEICQVHLTILICDRQCVTEDRETICLFSNFLCYIMSILSNKKRCLGLKFSSL